MTDRRTDGRTDDGLCEQLYSAKSYIINQILKKKNLLAKKLLKKVLVRQMSVEKFQELACTLWFWFLSLSRNFIFPLSVNGCKFDFWILLDTHGY